MSGGTLYGHSELVAEFAARLLGFSRGFGECQAVGFLDKDGKLEGAIVYHNYQPENGVIEISGASTCRTWLNRDRLRTIFDYPFRIGCRMIVTRTGEHNHVRRIWRSLGADEIIVPALRSPTEAEVIYTLTREQWQGSKFGKPRNGQEKSAPST